MNIYDYQRAEEMARELFEPQFDQRIGDIAKPFNQQFLKLKKAFMLGAKMIAEEIEARNMQGRQMLRERIELLEAEQRIDREKIKRMVEFMRTGNLETGPVE